MYDCVYVCVRSILFLFPEPFAETFAQLSQFSYGTVYIHNIDLSTQTHKRFCIVPLKNAYDFHGLPEAMLSVIGQNDRL